MKRIAILTSSRADYGIYLPLLKRIKEEQGFDLKLIVFGTHLSHNHGFTIDQIINDGFVPNYKIESLAKGDSPDAIAKSIATTISKFAELWRDNWKEFDLVLCLGDRYEMYAAVVAGIPFNIQFAHLHGGEKTLGSIDNIFRHSITMASKYHFVSCEAHAKRVSELIESSNNIFNVGSLSLDNLKTLSLLSTDEFFNRYGVDLAQPTILVTMHPETISPQKNGEYANELASVLLELAEYQSLITLPNADTYSSHIRKRFIELPIESNNRIKCFENLGSQGYFTAMKHCSFLLGNTSSGIIEAASFGKWVINLGSRQEGRTQSPNTFTVPFKKDLIIQTIDQIAATPKYLGQNIYYKENVAEKICSILNTIA